jgi:hypothetical protein
VQRWPGDETPASRSRRQHLPHSLPKGRIALTEIVTAGGASLCIGFGIVALFTTVGVHV